MSRICDLTGKKPIPKRTKQRQIIATSSHSIISFNIYFLQSWQRKVKKTAFKSYSSAQNTKHRVCRVHRDTSAPKIAKTRQLVSSCANTTEF